MTKQITFLLILLAFSVQAQVVDTWVFASQPQRQAALAIAGELRCPQCQNQSLLESNSPVAVSMRHEVFYGGAGQGQVRNYCVYESALW